MVKRLVKSLLSGNILIPSYKRIIFLYHDVSDPGSAQYSELYSTPVLNFYEQVEWLSGHFDLVSLDEITRPGKSNRRLASITFDDGFYSVKETAMPFLHDRNIPFAVFVNRAAVENNCLTYLGADRQLFTRTYSRKVYLDREDVKELHRLGVIIGNHSSTHQVLSQCKDEADLRAEILDNKLYLESVIQDTIRHFSIPYGKKEHYNRQVLDVCYQTGHPFTYTTNPVYFDHFDLNAGQTVLPRISFTRAGKQDLLFCINRPRFKKINI